VFVIMKGHTPQNFLIPRCATTRLPLGWFSQVVEAFGVGKATEALISRNLHNYPYIKKEVFHENNLGVFARRDDAGVDVLFRLLLPGGRLGTGGANAAPGR